MLLWQYPRSYESNLLNRVAHFSRSRFAVHSHLANAGRPHERLESQFVVPDVGTPSWNFNSSSQTSAGEIVKAQATQIDKLSAQARAN
jgi:hypothetical protein